MIIEDLVFGENVFFCVIGVIDGDLFKGVCYYFGGCIIYLIVMCLKFGIVWMIEVYYWFLKFNEYFVIDFIGDSSVVYLLF